jgi:hypothetical protein
VCRDWGIWQSERDFRDKHASQFTTGRFVLLPKNLVTGAAKALANHGEFLAAQIPELTSDIDCIVLAAAFDSTGDYIRA